MTVDACATADAASLSLFLLRFFCCSQRARAWLLDLSSFEEKKLLVSTTFAQYVTEIDKFLQHPVVDRIVARTEGALCAIPCSRSSVHFSLPAPMKLAFFSWGRGISQERQVHCTTCNYVVLHNSMLILLGAPNASSNSAAITDPIIKAGCVSSLKEPLLPRAVGDVQVHQEEVRHCRGQGLL